MNDLTISLILAGIITAYSYALDQKSKKAKDWMIRYYEERARLLSQRDKIDRYIAAKDWSKPFDENQE